MNVDVIMTRRMILLLVFEVWWYSESSTANVCFDMQSIKVNLVWQNQCLKNENVYLTKTILVYVIYTVLIVSVQV